MSPLPYGWKDTRKLLGEPKPEQPQPPTEQDLLQCALERVQRAARDHRDAVETALQWKGKHTPDHLVQAVLNAGTALDGAIRGALDKGHPAAKLARTAWLHPLYVATLKREDDPQRSFYI